MFGYIKPDSNELKVKEYETYKAAYCGLCRVMGKRYSFVYKMSLSYDFVFMVLLRLYAMPEQVSFVKKRCIAHPTKKKLMMNENEALKTASDIGVIMLYHNFVDKIRDRDGKKTLLYRLIMPELKRLHKKACNNVAVKEFDSFANKTLAELGKYETERVESIDVPAEAFGAVLGKALSFGMSGKVERKVFEIGRSIGKWIYVTDALDDIEKDLKNNSYNPLLAVYGSAEEAKKHGNAINTALLRELDSAYKAFALLDKSDQGLCNILENIITLGNVGYQERIMKKTGFLPTQNEGAI